MPACAACDASDLAPHLAVGAAARPEDFVPTTDRYGTALANIVRCARCGHMQLERLPAEAELRDTYAGAESSAYLSEEAGERATARRLLALAERHARRGALLDVGCWAGFLLAEARDRGWDPLGLEPSKYAADYARGQLGVEVVSGELLDAPLPERRFEAIVMADVIEHLPRPGVALERVAALLADDGVLVLALPDAGSRIARLLGRRWWSILPTHLHYFTRTSVRTLLERHGYRVVHLGTAPKSFSVAYYLGRVRGYAPLLAEALVRGARLARLADRIWAPDFRDRMTVLARR